MKLPLLFILFFHFTITCSNAQVQIGTDIDGEAAEDNSGFSTSLSSDGSRVIIGAPKNDENLLYAGHARVFEWTGASWEQLGDDLDGYAAGIWFGRSTSISSDGSRVAVGASRSDGIGSNSGHVSVFEWSGSIWQQLGADIEGEEADELSGFSTFLSADGMRVAIGAPFNDFNGTSTGVVRIYEWTGNNWVKLGSDISGDSSNDTFGRSISLSWDGRRIAIGAPYNDDNGSNTGFVRIYDWNGVNWIQVGNDINGETEDEYAGFSSYLSADGNRVIVGAYQNEENGTNSGQARVYELSGNNWTQIGTDINGEASGDFSGQTVSISSDGDIIAIGAPQNDGNGIISGHVRVYKWMGNNWSQIGTDIDGESAHNYFGHSISLSSNGGHIAIGAPSNDDNGTDAGHVRVYSLEDLVNITDHIKTMKNSIYVSPNPTKSKVTLHLPKSSSNVSIQVKDLNGKLISSKEYIHTSEPTFKLNAPSGIYFVEVIVNTAEIEVLKLIIE